MTLFINGTLENGTAALNETDSGYGTVSGAYAVFLENLGWCWMMGVVIYTVFGL